MDYSHWKVPVEVWTRSVGYFRPISQMNLGKQAEVKDRKMLAQNKALSRRIYNGKI